MPLTRERLDKLRCGNAFPTKNHDPAAVVVCGECHPGAATNLSYDRRTGTVRVTCWVCDNPLGDIAVASERRLVG